MGVYADAGYPNYVVDGWFAVVGPKGLPNEQVKRIQAALVTAFSTAEVKEAMAKQGNTISITSPEAANAQFKKKLTRYAGLIKKAGVVPQ